MKEVIRVLVVLGLTAASGLPVDSAEPLRINKSAELETLRPILPKEPAEAVKTFEASHGFRVELVACEPNVTDPVAACFDENGWMYVAEMIDYPDPYREGQKPLGRVRLLKDADGDGVFESSAIFADAIRWPTGVVCWKQGVFVAAAPDIWYLKDNDGDGHADLRQQVYTGFGVQNQQGTVNNLAWSLDNRIYGSSSNNGGQIRTHDQNAATVALDGNDFRFDPATRKFETVSGHAQFGNAFDDWGNRFVCSQANPGMHVVLPREYLARNPFLPVRDALEDLALGETRIFRSSPVEPWRAIRSNRRLAAGERSATSSGLSHEVIDAAAGLTIYRGDAFPPEFRGDLFVGCSQNNLIHHRKVAPKGVTFGSRRAEKGTEFVRSTDIWFRPVNTFNAPDGTLYVCDMSREVIEAIHIPLDVAARLNLASGRDRGRIYRLAPPGFCVPRPPKLGAATSAQLVELLAHQAGWWRDTAQRLLYERQDKSAVPALRKLLRTSELAQGRLHALWTLRGLDALSESDVALALRDASEHLREHGIRLAEPFFGRSPALVERVLALADDPATRVRFQAAFSIGEISDERKVAALARIALRDGSDHWMRTAILSSSWKISGPLLSVLARNAEFTKSDSGRTLLEQLAMLVGASKQTDQIEAVCQLISRPSALPAAWQSGLLCALCDGVRRGGADFVTLLPRDSPARRLLARQLETAASSALDPNEPVAQRAAAIEVLRYGPFADVAAPLRQLVAADQPESVRAAAIKALGAFTQPEVADIVLADWRQYGPSLRQEVDRLLFSRPVWTERLLTLLERGEIPVDELGPSLRSQLGRNPDRAIVQRAQRLFGENADRAAVIERYRAALSLAGDPGAGSEVYERQCAACHRLGDRGNELGPNLALTRNRTAEALLVHILDPNREVQPNYLQYVVVDDSGRTLTGVVTADTATSVTLARERGASETILKSNIEQMASTGRSMMPEGFERTIDEQSMANLLAFLVELQYDVGTIPGEDIPGQSR